MSNRLVATRDRLQARQDERSALIAQMETISTTAERSNRSALTPAETERFDKLHAEVDVIDAELIELRSIEADLARYAERADNARSKSPAGTTRIGRSFGDSERGTALRHVDNELRIPDSVRSAAVDIIERAEGSNGGIAAIAAATGDPDYLAAWCKVLRDPVRGHMEHTDRERAAFTKALDLQRAMSVGTPSAGGYMVPFVLDPSVVITGTGSINPMRKLATVKTVPAGNWHGVTAAQVTASWDTEASAVSDDSPTLVQPSIPSYLGRAWIQASFETFQDVADLANEVMKLMADAKDNLEATTHATSTGSGSPTGVVYAVGAVTASRVAPTTGGTIGLADAFKVQNALPARHSKRATWGSSITIINTLRQSAMQQNSANSVWTDSAVGEPPNFLGRGYEEFSAMSASITTGQDVLLYGDFAKYQITDVVGSPTVEFVPNLFDVSTGRPTSQRGYMLWFRQGGGVLDADAFRLARL